MMKDGVTLDGALCISLLQKLLQSRKPELAADVLRNMLSIRKVSDLVDDVMISEVVAALNRGAGKSSLLAKPFLKELKDLRPTFVFEKDQAKMANYQERGKAKNKG